MDIFELAIALKSTGESDILAALRRIGDEGKKAADKVGDAEKSLEQELRQRLRTFDQLSRATNLKNADAVRTYNKAAEALSAWGKSAGLTAEQQLRLEAALVKVDRRSDRLQGAMERATAGGIRGFSALSRGAEGAADAVQGLGNTVTELLQARGIEGPLVAGLTAAAGVAAAAIAAIWKKHREEIEAERKATEAHFAHMVELAKKNPASVATQLRGAERSEAQVQADLDKARKDLLAFGSDPQLAGARREIQRQITSLEEALKATGSAAVAALTGQAVAAIERQGEAAKKAADDAKDAAENEVETLTALAQLRRATVPDFLRMYELERQLTAAIDGGTLSREKRLDAERKLAALRAAQVQAPAVGGLAQMLGGGLPTTAGLGSAALQGRVTALGAPRQEDLGDVGGVAGGMFMGQFRRLAQQFEVAAGAARETMADTVAKQFGEGLKNSIAGAFQDAFSGGGLGGLLQSFTRGLLSSLGAMFIAVGKEMVKFGAIMEGIADAIRAALAFSGPAAIVGGLALIALGGALGGLGAGGAVGGRGGSAATGGRFGGGAVPGFGGTPIRYTLPAAGPAATSMERAPVVMPVFNIYGRDDRQFQAAIFQAWEGARKQGYGTAGMGSYRRGGGGA